MKRTTLLFFVTAIISIIIFPSSVFAVWWNPFTWKVFSDKNIKLEQEVKILENKAIDTSTHNVIATTTVINETLTQPKISESVKKSPLVQVTTSPITVQINNVETISPKDQADITSTIQKFLTSIQKKDAVVTSSFISNKSKSYFDTLLDTARTSPKKELLRKDFTTIATVVLVRLVAASTTLDLKGNDVIQQAVTIGSSAWIDSLDLNNLQFKFERIDTNTIQATSQDIKQLSVKFNVFRENDSWKIDYIPTLTQQNANMEKQLQKTMQETGKTREEIMETLLQFFFGRFNTELDYLIWVPLNERGELKAENAKFQSFTDSPNGWSMLFPEHWTIDKIDSTVFFLAPYTMDGIRPSIAITPNQQPTSTKLDRYVDYILDELPKVKVDIDGSIESNKTTFHNQPAYRITYNRLRTFDGGRTYIKQIIDSIVFFNNGIAYLIEYRNGIADFDKTKPLTDRAIETFQFEEICTNYCISRQ